MLSVLILTFAIIVAFVSGYLAGRSKQRFIVTNRQREGDRRKQVAETARLAQKAREADNALGVEYLHPGGTSMFRCRTCNRRVMHKGAPEWGDYCSEHKPQSLTVVTDVPTSNRDVLSEIKRRSASRVR